MINDVYLRFKELYIQTDGKILSSKFALEKEHAICIKIDEDANVIEKLIVDKNVKKDDLYDWFSIMNLKAKYLDSNKAVGSKMIFSNSNLALFGRFDTFPMVTLESFKKLFDVKPDLTNKKTIAKSQFYSDYKDKVIAIFQPSDAVYFVDEFIQKCDFFNESDVKLLSEECFITEVALSAYFKKLVEDYTCNEEQFFTKERLLYILSQLKNEFKEYAHKQIKVKIFRNKSVSEYQESEIKYLSNSLFTVEDESKKIGDLGLPFLDNTLNASKPFMLHLNTKYKITFPKSKNEALYIKYLDDYLSIDKGIFYLEIENFTTQDKPFLNADFGQFIIMKKKNYELFEFLPSFISEFEKNPLILKNHLLLLKDKIPIDDKQPFYEEYLLEDEINKLFFNKLKTNYLSEKIDKTEGKLVNLIFIVRGICFSYFRKGQITGKEFYAKIANYITDMILYHYEHADDSKIKFLVSEFLNLKISLNEYYKGEVMDIRSKLQALKEKISVNDYEKLSKEDFLLLSGQMAYYLVSQSESSNRTFRLVEHYLKAKNIKMLKNHLRNDLEKYKHKLNLISKTSKFKNAYSMLLAFEDNEKISHDDIDALLIGLMTDNIFYTN
jgi:CRISPR-associated protein Csh1